jgi:hypothetical protein
MMPLLPAQLEDSVMTHSDPHDDQLPVERIENYPGKLGRRDFSTWVRICPRCFSPNVEPLTNISGFIVHEQWYCKKCQYSGVTIEVKTEDLIHFIMQQRLRRFNQNQKG